MVMEEKKRTQDGKNGGRSDELERSLTEARSELIEHECLELREANRQLSAQADWHTHQLTDLQSSLFVRLSRMEGGVQAAVQVTPSTV